MKPLRPPEHRPRPLSVPPDALCIVFTADNGKSGEYYIWWKWVNVGARREKRHYWYAQGNNGEARSGYEATLDARDWIKNGLSGKGRVG